MAKADIERVMDVSKDRLFDVITQYGEYPQFLPECKSVEVDRKTEGQARAHYRVELMKSVNYVLDHREDRSAGRVTWTLVDSDVFKSNTGTWTLTPEGEGKVRARYEIDVEFKIPVPGFVLKKIVKGSLPSMMDRFEKQAKKG